MSGKQVRAQYTQEFKLEAVRQVKAGQSISVVAKVLGIPKASLGNWVRQEPSGNVSGAGENKAAAVTPEQMELARLRAENARLPADYRHVRAGEQRAREVALDGSARRLAHRKRQ